jgi:hypothetical protein
MRTACCPKNFVARTTCAASTLWDGQADGENLGLGMGPNPFVNPNQRGVELPGGCKDLMDVLKMGGVDRPAAGRPMISYGALREIEQRVATFLQWRASELLFSVGVPKRGILVILLNRTEGLILNFSVPANQESMKDLIRRIFENPKFGENVCGTEYVSVALNPAKDWVARMMVELLVEGFGVLEEEQLMFVSYKAVDGTREE